MLAILCNDFMYRKYIADNYRLRIVSLQELGYQVMAASHYISIVLLLVLFSRVKSNECFPWAAVNQTAYYNWPIYLDCGIVAADCALNEGDYRCSIVATETNETLHSSDYEYYYEGNIPGYEIENVTMDSPNIVHFNVQSLANGVCCSKAMQLQKRTLPAYGCEDFPDTCTIGGSEETSVSEWRTFTCKLPYISGEPELQNLANYPITWYYNCNESLPEEVTVNDKNQLVIPSFDPFLHPGNYSCAIEHKGETRRITEYCVCAKPIYIIAEISVICSTDKVRYSVGDTATILCNVNVGGGSINRFLYVMTFYPMRNGTRDRNKDDLSCTSELHDEVAGLSGRVNCSFKVVGDFQKDCFHDIPTQEEWELAKNKSQKIFEMTYTLSRLEDSDFGYYEAYIGTASGENVDFAVVQFALDLREKDRALRIGIAVGVTVLVLIIIGCVIYIFRFHIRIAWKRSNCVKYDKDLLKYGAYFTYYWSNAKGETEDLEKYEKLINGMEKCIEELGFTIYDPTKHPAQYQWQHQNMQLVQGECDRVVVILTSQFLDEPNAEQDLFMNFLEKKYILVTTPDFERAFKKLENSHVRNGLNAHFQRNGVLKWSGRGEELSTRLQLELELAMPKNRRGKDSRLV